MITLGAGYYPNLDILKYLSALCVVWIHVSGMSGYANPKWFDIILTTAVPFFFVSSGLLMGKHAEASGNFSKYFKNKSINLIRIWIIWLLIYLPLDIFECCPVLTIKWIAAWSKHALIYGEGGLSWPLWFIFSMIIGCLLLSVATRKRIILGTIVVFILSSALSFFTSMTSPSDLYGYFGIFGNSPTPPLIDVRLIRLLSGPICLSAGIMLSWIRFKQTDKRYVISIAFLLIVTGCIMHCYGIALNILPRSIGLILIAILLPQVKINTRFIRQQSMWIYYCHMYCIILIRDLYVQNHFQTIPYGLTVMIASMAVGWILTKISDTQRFKFLKFLIN